MFLVFLLMLGAASGLRLPGVSVGGSIGDFGASLSLPGIHVEVPQLVIGVTERPVPPSEPTYWGPEYPGYVAVPTRSTTYEVRPTNVDSASIPIYQRSTPRTMPFYTEGVTRPASQFGGRVSEIASKPSSYPYPDNSKNGLEYVRESNVNEYYAKPTISPAVGVVYKPPYTYQGNLASYSVYPGKPTVPQNLNVHGCTENKLCTVSVIPNSPTYPVKQSDPKPVPYTVPVIQKVPNYNVYPVNNKPVIPIIPGMSNLPKYPMYQVDYKPVAPTETLNWFGYVGNYPVYPTVTPSTFPGILNWPIYPGNYSASPFPPTVQPEIVSAFQSYKPASLDDVYEKPVIVLTKDQDGKDVVAYFLKGGLRSLKDDPHTYSVYSNLTTYPGKMAALIFTPKTYPLVQGVRHLKENYVSKIVLPEDVTLSSLARIAKGNIPWIYLGDGEYLVKDAVKEIGYLTVTDEGVSLNRLHEKTAELSDNIFIA